MIPRGAERGFTSLRRTAEHGFAFLERTAEHGVTSVRRSAEHGFAFLERTAEHGVTSVRRSAEHGFTLIELMVVVTVIGLASAAVVWVIPDPRGRVLDEATRFAARTRAAHDSAIVEGRPVSVWMDGGGYGFDRRVAGGWIAVSEKPLRVERWSEGTLADPRARVRVTFDSTGMVDRPADLRLSRGTAAATIRIDADGSVRADAG